MLLGVDPVSSARVTGSVARRVNAQLGSLSVVAGSCLSAVMTGTGDPDLYVRFGAPPTTRTHHCRPYQSGASEACNLTVPAGHTVAYLMVRGYTAATYDVNVTYAQP